ncbi:MAG: hypothetical protein U0359_06995 [Byssovorax sp.]
MRRASLALLIALSAGCAAEASPGVSYAPSPRASGPLRWQQFCEQTYSVPQASEVAAARGNDGWELVTMYNGVLCFKRPVPGAVLSAPASPGLGAPLRVPGYVPVVQEPGF